MYRSTQAMACQLGAGLLTSGYWTVVKEGIRRVGCVYTAQSFEY